MTIPTRLVIVILAILAAGFLALSLVIDKSVEPFYLESVEDDLVDMAMLLASSIEWDAESDQLQLDRFREATDAAAGKRFEARIYNHEKSRLGLRIYVTNHQGTVVYDSRGESLGEDFSKWNNVARTLSGGYGARASDEVLDGRRVLVLHVSAPIVHGEKLLGVVTVSKPTILASDYFRGVPTLLAVGLVLTFLVMGLLAWFITLSVTRPISRLNRYARAVSQGLRAEPPHLGNSEIGQLGRSFEQMRDALEGRNYIEGYVQTLTHEIKSPLSAIRGAAELIDENMPEEKRQAFLNNINVESFRIQRLVERLLELSAIENLKALASPIEVDLGDLAAEILASAEPAIQAKGLVVRYERGRAIAVRGDRFLLSLAISNLLQNAMDFTPRGGRIKVTFGRRSIQIHDSGPGIPDYAKQRIFERFYSLRREDTGRKSSGLGLSIVKQVADLHHGGIMLRNAEDGPGTVALLWFAKHWLLRHAKTGTWHPAAASDLPRTDKDPAHR